MIRFLLRAGLVLACLTYAVWGVDGVRLVTALGRLNPWAMLLYAATSFVLVGPVSLRLRFLLGGRLGYGDGLRACCITQSVNNLAPAHLGELVKILYVSKQSGLPLARIGEAVFWERFADLNALLALGMVVAVALQKTIVFWPLLIAVGGLWLLLGLVFACPGAVSACLNRLPGRRLRGLALEVMTRVASERDARFLGMLAGLTAVCWLCYLANYSLGLCLLAGFPVDPAMIAAGFTAGALGFAVPSIPGALGVYEASVVFALGWFGVDKDQALTVALTMHLLEYMPVTLVGVPCFLNSGLTADVRKALFVRRCFAVLADCCRKALGLELTRRERESDS